MESENEFKNILNDKLNAKQFTFKESDWDAMHEKIDEFQNEKELSGLLAEKLDEKEFAFSESDWEQASLVLENSRERKKRPAAIWFFAILLFLLGGLTFFMWNKAEVTENKLVNTKTNSSNEDPGANVPQENRAEMKTGSAPVHTLNRNEISAPQKAVDTNTRSNENDASNSSVQKTKMTEEVISSDKKENVSLEIKTKKVKTKKVKAVVAATIPVEDEKKEEKKIVAAVKSSPVKNGKDDGGDNNTDRTKNIPDTKKEDKKENPEEELSKNVLTKKNKEESVSDPPENNKNAFNNAIPTTSVTDPPLEKIVESGTVSLALEEKKSDTILAVHAPDTIVVFHLDTAGTAAALSKVKENKIVNFLSAEGGANYFMGWKNETQREGNGYTPIIGLQYSALIRKNWFIDLAANYYYVGKLSYSSHTSKITSYSLGEESKVSVFTPTKLHYFGFPVKLHYRLNKGQEIGGGLNIAYLFNVSTKLYTYTYKANSVTEEKTTRTYGYTQGLKSLDPQLSLFYRREIYNRLKLNTEFIFGLTDVKENGFFGANVYERNMAIRITLLYNFWRK
jgi:hypothetical protein